MRPFLPWATGVVSSHGSVRDTVQAHIGPDICVRVRVVGLREPGGKWKAIFCRCDIAKEADLELTKVRPKGGVVVAEEILSGEDFLSVLEPALMGHPLKVEGYEFIEHGMKSEWKADRATMEWREYGTAWPCVVLAPTEEAFQHQHSADPIDADGPVAVFDGIDHLLDYVAEIVVGRTWRGQDLRHRRVQVLIWDYRGRIDRCDLDGKSLYVAVSPPSARGLHLAGTASGASGRVKSIPIDAPTQHEIGLHEPVTRVNLVLKVGEEILSEVVMTRNLDAASARADRDGWTSTKGSNPKSEAATMKTARKYTVFISSTKKDLSKEREAVAGEILSADHIPCGMEQFSTSGEGSWKIITETIDICDYYVLILAGLYGTVDKETGMSWTEREYHYAVEKGLPVLAFIREDEAVTKSLLVEHDKKAKKKLQDFVKVVSKKQRDSWTTIEDLARKVTKALQKRIRKDEASGAPRAGWYRGDNLPVQMGSDHPQPGCGNVFWLGNNLAYTAYALETNRLTDALREWNHAIHHAKQAGVPQPLLTRLHDLQGRGFDKSVDERKAVINELHELWLEIGRFVESQQPDFPERDVQQDSKASGAGKKLSEVSTRPPFHASASSTIKPQDPRRSPDT